MNFADALLDAVESVGTPLGIGLDPHLDKLPQFLQNQYSGLQGEDFFFAASEAVVSFNELVIEAVKGKVAAVKPQFAFYEQLGSCGWAALEATCQMAREAGLLIIGDAKRGDISSTGAAYAKAILDPQGPLNCDAVTLNPWMGTDTLDPFLKLCTTHGKGIFVLVRTTNPESSYLQHHGSPIAAESLANRLAEIGERFVGERGFSSIGAVVGASAAKEAQLYRKAMPKAWFLVPGVGAQGGGAKQALAGRNQQGRGSLVVSSRSLLFPSNRGDVYDSNPQGVIDFVSNAVTSLGRKLAAI
jgi:orotidine-5'-phosphate decarboxylase